MINKKNKTYFFVVISFVCIVFIVGFHILDGRNITLFDPIIEYIKQYHIKDVVNIVAILSGISAILVGVASIRISNLGAVKEYFQQGDNKEYTTARHNLYKKFEEGVSIDPNDADASNTVSFFHFWGLMVKKKYLPFWVFKSASGHAVIRLYEGLREMIEIRRVDNPEYAEYFEWIYRKCCRALKHSEAAAFVPVEKKQNENSSFFSESELKAIGFLKYGKNVLVSRKASIYNPEQMVLGDNIRIDDFCILSGNIKLGSYIHIPAAYRRVIEGQVILEDYVSVGTGSTILPGVKLEEGVAVGAMSFVKHTLEGWKIYVGAPCRYVKDRNQNMKQLRLHCRIQMQMKKAGERMKPRIFIGSSKESVKIAEKVKSLLDGEYVCQLWCDNFFDLGQCTYHELLKKSLSFDYAIFIGGKDDYVRRESDRTHKYAARDNVYLEFGLYAGILTYARCFFVIQEGCQIASDLLGVNVVFFDKMQDLSKKILTITEKIQKEQKVARISLLPSTSLAVGYFENFLKPVSQAIQKLDEVCIAGKKYDVKNSDKRLEVAIPAKVSEDLRMWSEYVYENHAVEKVTVDSSIRKIGVNIDYGKLENTGDLTVIDVPLTLSAAYRSVELALGVDYIGIEEIMELAKEKELNNFIKTVNNLILEDIYTRKSVSVRKVYKDKL